MNKRCEPGPVVGIAELLDRLRLRRVWMDRPGDVLQAEAADHRQRDLRDHVTGVASDDGGAHDAVGPLADVNLDEPFVLTVQDGSVHARHLLNACCYIDADLSGIGLVEAYVGDLRVGVGAPGDRQRAGLRAAQEQGVLDGDPCQSIGRVGELEPAADVTRREDPGVRGA